MTDDDLPDQSFFRFERSLYDLTRPLDDIDQVDDIATGTYDEYNGYGNRNGDGDFVDHYVDPDEGLDDEFDVVLDIDDENDDNDEIDDICDVGEQPAAAVTSGDDDIDVAIDEFLRSILDDAASQPHRRTPPRFVDITRHSTSARRASAHSLLADRLLEFVYANLDGVSVMIASTVEGTGAYGRLTVDPLHSTEVRLFGWPRLQLRSPQADRSAIASLLRLGFVHLDGDWVWRSAPLPELVPVAAHAAQRALAEAWQIPPQEATPEHIRLYALDGVEIMLIASGVLCSWCADGECPGATAH